MNYMQEVDRWLCKLVPALEDAEAVRREIKDKILESYRNGQKACPKCRGKSGERELQRSKLTKPA